VRGQRNAMLSDYLWSFSGMQTKAIAHAVVAALIGDPLVMSASGSEHQGPPGGNVVTVFARAS
jgi:cyanuric acid amidohydrolase